LRSDLLKIPIWREQSHDLCLRGGVVLEAAQKHRFGSELEASIMSEGGLPENTWRKLKVLRIVHGAFCFAAGTSRLSRVTSAEIGGLR